LKECELRSGCDWYIVAKRLITKKVIFNKENGNEKCWMYNLDKNVRKKLIM
jgi:hypothetical protein